MAPLVARERTPAMRDSLFTRALALTLAVAIATVPTAAHASLFGEENGPLTTLVAQGIAELAQVADAIATAKQQLEIARDVYAGVNDFLNFDPQSFLDGQKQQWMAQVPLAGEVQGFVSDVTTNGLNGGHFNAKDLYGRFDTYRDQFRRLEAKKALGTTFEPYDAKSALTLSREAEAALASSSTRARLAAQSEPETVSEGLFASDAAKVDPALVSLYMQRRAQAKEAEYQAFKLMSEAMGASPGKAQQLAAMATGLSAQELARIDDKMGQSLSLQQLEQQQRATTKATERQEADFLWNDLSKATEKNFAPPKRGNIGEWEDL